MHIIFLNLEIINYLKRIIIATMFLKFTKFINLNLTYKGRIQKKCLIRQ